MIHSDAYFSPDRVYRYWLLRIWDDILPIMGNMGANPSKAAETLNDPTVRKDTGFATRLGYGGLLKMNVGAYCATDPREWRRAADPFGDENTVEDIKRYMKEFGVTMLAAAWGRCLGEYSWMGACIRDQIDGVHCFGLNADGTPRHTLMLPYTTPLVPWRAV